MMINFKIIKCCIFIYTATARLYRVVGIKEFVEQCTVVSSVLHDKNR